MCRAAHWDVFSSLSGFLLERMAQDAIFQGRKERILIQYGTNTYKLLTVPGWSDLFRVFQAAKSKKGENKGEKQDNPP